MRLHTALRWQQNINQASNSQQTPHSLPSRASYGVSNMRILEENWPCHNGTTLYVYLDMTVHWTNLCSVLVETYFPFVSMSVSVAACLSVTYHQTDNAWSGWLVLWRWPTTSGTTGTAEIHRQGLGLQHTQGHSHRLTLSGISQTTFSNASSWMKMCWFWLEFH